MSDGGGATAKESREAGAIPVPTGRATLGQLAVQKVPASAAQPQRAPVQEKRESSLRGLLLGEILVARGRLDEVTLRFALERQAEVGGLLGELLVMEGLVHEGDVIRALSEQTGIPFVSDAKVQGSTPPADVLALLQPGVAERLLVLPLALRNKELFCAMREPRDLAVLDELKFVTGVPAVRGVFATEGTLRRGIARYYRGEESAAWEASPGPAAVPIAVPMGPLPEAEPIPVEAVLVPEAAVLLDEAPIAELRSGLLDALFERMGPWGTLPARVRRLGVGFPADQLELAVAAAQTLLAWAQVAGREPGEIPTAAELEESLGPSVSPCAAVVEGCVSGSGAPGSAGELLGAAVAEVRRSLVPSAAVG